ncbi:uncharacterized protein [Bemisia tabaci]|uniref:uncharacterized protein isoform X4 n=1 Tax=Bemisia tabaci TaxID=7038 RepID=UPI003B283B5F
MRFDQFIVMSGKLAATKLQPNRVLSRKKSEAPTATVKRKTVRIKSKSVKEFFRSFTKLNEKDPSSGKSHARKSKDKEKDKENRPKSKTKRRADPQQIVYTKRKILYVIKGDEESGEMVTARDSPTQDGNVSAHDSDKESTNSSRTSNLKLIRYSRAELMKIGDDPICQTKPKIDPKLSIILPSDVNRHIMRTSNQRLILSPIDVMAAQMPVRPHSYSNSNSDPFSALYPKFKSAGSQSPTHEERPQTREIPLDSKSRTGDPRDRVRKDQDGIVLSPQRRSFNTGCFVTVQSGRQSPSAKPLDSRDGPREVRRIGSGRILTRGEPMGVAQNWSSQSSEFPFRSGGPARESVAFERRFNREFERDKDRNSRMRDNDRITLDRNNRYNKSGMNNNNNNNDKRYNRWNEPEEPEWFSGGPTSQHDTIELHGFEKLDDSDGDDRRQRPGSRSKKMSEPSSEGGNSNDDKRSDGRKSISPIDQEQKKDRESQESSEAERKDEGGEKKEKDDPEKKDTDNNGGKSSGDSSGFISDFAGTDFNFDDFLKSDSLPLLSNGTDRGDGGVMESRFASWFKRDVPQGSGCDSNRSSAHDEMFNSMINDITESNAPNRRNSFSPEPSGTSAALMDMLRTREGSGDASEKYPSLRDLEVTGKLHSVGELESRFRQQQVGPKDSLSGRGQTLSSKKEEELAAFKKLMMSKAHAVPQCTSTGPEMPGMMGGFYQPGMPLQPNQMNQPNVPNELVMKLLQVQQQQVQQQDTLSKILTAHPGMQVLPPPIQQLVNQFQPTPELLARPETQNILTSLKRGELSLHQLAEQLRKTATFQSRHRDILATVIKLYQSQTGGIPPRTNSPLPAVVNEQMLHQLLLSQQQSQHQAQQLRIPSPHANAYCPTPSLSPNLVAAAPNTLTVQHPGIQRVPSPRELVAHTQNILQSALIKKKLEEQKENFRKRQELQRSHSPNLSNSSINSRLMDNNEAKSLRVLGANSPTPANLAFTPTSVLRKMTAGSNAGDKDPALDPLSNLSSIPGELKPGLDSNAGPLPGSHWNNPRPVGRPIVKSSSMVPPPTFQPSIPPPSMMNEYLMNVPPPPSQYNVMPPRSKMSQPSSQYNNAMMMGLNRPSNYPSRDMNSSNRGMRSTPFPMGNSQNMFGQDSSDMPGEMSSSQVNNQLLRWFSPELLAQARAGQLPNMPPVSPAQNMLSVEEIERLQQPVKN